jgi:putative transposase
VVQEAYIQGISTRSVDELVKALGMTGISKSQVSRLCTEIDERVQAFLNRPIEGDWPYLLDRRDLRESARVGPYRFRRRYTGRGRQYRRYARAFRFGDGPQRSRAVLDGVSPKPEPTWSAWREAGDLPLARRSQGGIAKVFKATWQRCRVHFMRNALAHAGKGQRQVVLALINTVFAQETAEAAHQQWRIVADQLREKFPKLSAMLDDAEHDVLAFMAFPKAHRKQLAPTNPLERINAEIKRRMEVVGIFPNEAVIVRLVGALLLEAERRMAVTAAVHAVRRNERRQRQSDRQAFGRYQLIATSPRLWFIHHPPGHDPY